jgi:aspartyl protease family protein
VAQGGWVFAISVVCALALVGSRTERVRERAEIPAAVEPVRVDQAPPPQQGVGNGYASVSIPRALDNHFYADAEVNGTTVRFLVDTGATSVLLAPQDAERAGIHGSDFSETGVGVGGEVQLMPATVSRLALGPLSASNVPVMVAKDKLSVSLLGQSYLARIGTVSITGDTMTLK